MQRTHLAVLLGALMVAPASAGADHDAGACDDDPSACAVEAASVEGDGAPRGSDAAEGTRRLLFFWGVGCPHCDAARPFVDRIERAHSELRVERVEVRRSRDGARRFVTAMRAADIEVPGIPAFVLGREAVLGYRGRDTERAVERLLAGLGAREVGTIDLPLVGTIAPSRLPLLELTLLVGFVDGFNPCAIWVLLVLLGILLRVRSRRLLLIYGGTFVVASGVVYFAFMSAWAALFGLVGLSRFVSVLLGIAVMAMGAINLKEVIWFRQGPSLVIPDRVKPRLFRRMRGVAEAARVPTALGGIIALAFVVNLVELGCTLGLPAVYTRVLSLREISGAARVGYLALYNVAYVVPLAVVLAAYGLTLHRFALGESGAKVLKAVSGLVLVLLGAVLVAAPELLG